MDILFLFGEIRDYFRYTHNCNFRLALTAAKICHERFSHIDDKKERFQHVINILPTLDNTVIQDIINEANDKIAIQNNTMVVEQS